MPIVLGHKAGPLGGRDHCDAHHRRASGLQPGNQARYAARRPSEAVCDFELGSSAPPQKQDARDSIRRQNHAHATSNGNLVLEAVVPPERLSLTDLAIPVACDKSATYSARRCLGSGSDCPANRAGPVAERVEGGFSTPPLKLTHSGPAVSPLPASDRRRGEVSRVCDECVRRPGMALAPRRALKGTDGVARHDPGRFRRPDHTT